MPSILNRLPLTRRIRARVDVYPNRSMSHEAENSVNISNQGGAPGSGHVLEELDVAIRGQQTPSFWRPPSSLGTTSEGAFGIRVKGEAVESVGVKRGARHRDVIDII